MKEKRHLNNQMNSDCSCGEPATHQNFPYCDACGEKQAEIQRVANEKYKRMKMRDDFAMRAMHQFCATDIWDDQWIAKCAERSYALADAMMKVRGE